MHGILKRSHLFTAMVMRRGVHQRHLYRYLMPLAACLALLHWIVVVCFHCLYLKAPQRAEQRRDRCYGRGRLHAKMLYSAAATAATMTMTTTRGRRRTHPRSAQLSLIHISEPTRPY